MLMATSTFFFFWDVQGLPSKNLMILDSIPGPGELN